MKRRNLSLSLAPSIILSLFMTLVSCTKDTPCESCQANPDNLPKLEVKDLPGEVRIAPRSNLKLSATVNGESPDMEYRWFIIDPIREKTHMSEVFYTADTISKEKDLDYYVSLKAGRYILGLKVTDNNTGVSSISTTDLEVSTPTSRGFYILKENAQGDTDIDLFSPEVPNTSSTGNLFFDDLLKNNKGSALPGKPLTIGVMYSQYHLDLERFEAGEEEMTFSTTLCITTQEDSVIFITTSELADIYPDGRMFYIPRDKGFKPIRGFSNLFSSMLLSNQGIHSAYHQLSGSGGRGILSEAIGEPATEHVVSNSSGLEQYYWSSNQTGAYAMDYNAEVYPVDGMPGELRKMECLSAGCSQVGSQEAILYFLLQSSQSPHTRYLAYIDEEQGTFMKADTIPASLPLSTAKVFAACTRSANLIYYTDGSKLHGMTLDKSMNDRILPLQGIGAGEEITYLSNRYWIYKKDKPFNFDYLIVGTQKGDAYTIYFYNLLGGTPDGAPVHKISGKGIVRMVDYVSTNVADYDGLISYPIVDI